MDCLKKIWQKFIHPEKLQVPYHLDCQTSVIIWFVQRKIFSTNHRPLGLSLGLFKKKFEIILLLKYLTYASFYVSYVIHVGDFTFINSYIGSIICNYNVWSFERVCTIFGVLWLFD